MTRNDEIFEHNRSSHIDDLSKIITALLFIIAVLAIITIIVGVGVLYGDGVVGALAREAICK